MSAFPGAQNLQVMDNPSLNEFVYKEKQGWFRAGDSVRTPYT
jgi:hypothetical protein